METNNIKIAYDPKFLSKEEIAKSDIDNSDIELIEHSLNSNAPKNDLILSICLFLISSAAECYSMFFYRINVLLVGDINET